MKFICIATLCSAAAIVLVASLVAASVVDAIDCHKAGGVYISGHCIRKDAVLEVK